MSFLKDMNVQANLICQAALPRSPVFSALPGTRRTSSVRSNGEGSRIPRPVPFDHVSNSSDSRGRADYASTDSDDSNGTVKIKTAIPVRVQRESTSVRLIPQDKQSTLHGGEARLVNMTPSSGASQTSGQTSSAVPSELNTINEQSSSRTSVDTPTAKQRYGPILRVSSAAEHRLRGSRSVSFAEFSEAHQSGNVFYPRTLRGDTPPSDDQEDNLRGQEASSPQSPVDSIQHQTKRKSVRAPPRASSLSALSDIAAQQTTSVGGPALPLDLKQNISFEDLVTRHPEVEGVVRETNVIRAPQPRVIRVIDGIRSAFSLGRAERRAASTFQIQRKSKRSAIPRPVRSPTLPPATPSEVDRALKKLRSEIERPVARWGRPGLMPSTEQVRVAVNAVGRELVNSDSRELRKGWFRVSLPSLYIRF